MIVAEQKPLAEVKQTVASFSKLLILGCGTCVKTCFAGGEDEVATLASALRLSFKKDGKDIGVEEFTVERQCEDEFIQQAAPYVARADAVLSLACGAGVQMVGSRFARTPVLPGVNTTFIGILDQPGIFAERCLGCGNCIVGDFAGVCPISRCSKKLLNGPCGGSQNGKCEVNAETDCVWQTIIDRFKGFGQLHKLDRFYPPRDWRPSYSGGPRKLVREDHIV